MVPVFSGRTFPFPSQSMLQGRGVVPSTHTKTFSGSLLPGCHTSNGLSMGAGRPYFQMPIAMFIVISLPILQHTPGRGTALLGLPVLGPAGTFLPA